MFLIVHTVCDTKSALVLFNPLATGEITYVSVATKLAELENKFSLLCNANKSKGIEPEIKNIVNKQKQSTTPPRRRSESSIINVKTPSPSKLTPTAPTLPDNENVSIDKNIDTDLICETLNNETKRNETHQAPKFAMSYAKTEAENNDGWRYHTNRKRQQQKRLQLRGQGRAVDCPLVGAPEPIRKVFVSRMNCDTTISSLKNYLESRKVNVREIIQTSRETSKFKSFKVTVDRCNYQQMFSINMWSKGVNVDPFRERKTNQITHNG